MRSIRLKTVLSVLLSLGLLLPCVGAAVMTADAAGQELARTDRYVHKFDSAPPASGFSSASDGFGMSFVGGSTRAQVVEGSDAIEGRSVRVSAADWRWWSVSYTDSVMGLSMDIRVDDGFRDTALYFGAQNHVGSTSTESSTGGRLIVIRADENGDPALYDYEGKKCAVLERNRTLTVTAEAGYGEPTYSLYVGDTLVSGDSRFADAFYSVKGLKLYAESASSDSYILVDNLYAYTKGRTLPQKNSYQEPGEMPEIILPEVPSVEGVAVWADDVLVPVPALRDGEGVMLPLDAVMEAFGARVSMQDDGRRRIDAPEGRAAYTLSLFDLQWNDEIVRLSRSLVTDDAGVTYAPAQVFAEVLGVKVWYAEALDMVVLTPPEKQNDNVLRAVGGTLWMNGEPYYEISFNKWDLNNQIAADPSFNGGEFVSRSWATEETTLAGAERALRELSENGFKTIRVFCNCVNPCRGEDAVAAFFEKTDCMYDLCDRYGIRVVACLGLTSEEFVDMKYAEGAGWVNGKENYFDFFTNPDSLSRQHVYDFIDLYINRYKDRDTILMWEICNEGNLDADVGDGSSATYSLFQLGAFYADVTARIKANDPVHLVTGGDSMIRSAQWHLLKAVMDGRGRDFTVDDTDQRRIALWIINSGLDVVSVHGYGVGYDNNGGHAKYIMAGDKRKRERIVNWDLLMSEARSLGLPLYNGETGGMMDAKGREFSAANTSAEAAEARVRFLDNLVENGVQLTHWWTFNSDRVDFGMDLDSFTVTLKDTPETFAAIKAANEALKARYLVNPMASENTYTLTGRTGDGAVVLIPDTEPAGPDDTEPTESATLPAESGRETEPVTGDGTESTPDETTSGTSSGCGSALGAGAVLTAAAAAVVIRKKKNEGEGN